ncbi:MAG TPA: hypothetical protein VFT06_10225, partial [Flavisolibacter sp.]|nr:hypothetical protein [Flavisolibacter sp.]
MTVNINGKEYRLHFGCTSVEQFYQRSGVLKQGSFFSAKLYASVVYAGIYNEAEKNDTEPDISFTEVYEWVETQVFDTEGKAVLERVAAAFQASQALQSFIKQ